MRWFVTLWHTLRQYCRFVYVTLLARDIAKPIAATGTRHLAILAWSFAPDINGGVYRPAALARYARESGYRVTVFAGAMPEKPTRAGKDLLDSVGEDVEIVRTEPSGPAPSYRLFPRLDGGLHCALDLFVAARSRFRAGPPGVIIATGPPFHVFVAGMWLARAFGTRLVLDYRDEWTLCPFDFVSSKGFSDQKWERRCLEAADRVIVTTDSFREHLCRNFDVPGLAEKCHVVANGWEPAESAVSTGTEQKDTDRLLLLHAGSVGSHTRVTPFLELLEAFLENRPAWADRLLVRFVGPKRPEEEEALRRFPFPGVVESLPVVPLHEAVRQMRAADGLLLLLDSRWARYRQGKLYEYVASGKPVVVFDDEGECWRVVQKMNSGWPVGADDVAALECVLERLMRGEIPAPAGNRGDWLKAHTREALTRRFLEILAGIS